MMSTITVADEILAKCREIFTHASVIFKELKTKIDFLVVEDVPVGVLIGIPEI